MTSSEDSADDFESADEDFDIGTKSSCTNILEKKPIELIENNLDDGFMDNLNTVNKVEKSFNQLETSSKNISRSSSDTELPDFGTETPNDKNLQLIPNYEPISDSLENENTLLKQNDEENNSLCSVTQQKLSLSSTKKTCEPLDKEDNQRPENLILPKNTKQSRSGQQEPTSSSFLKGINPKVDDENEKLAKEVTSGILNFSTENINTTEVEDGWDFEEEEDLENGSIIDTTQTVRENTDILRRATDKSNTKSNEGWGDFDMDDDNFTDKPGDGWEIEEEDVSEIPISSSKLSETKAQSSQVHNSGIKPSESSDEQGWGGWGGWGVSSLLSTATGSVTTFSSQVTAGLSSVLETTVGAPDPETLAANTAASDSISEPQDDKPAANYVGLGSIVSGVSFLGSTVINRGLDTLENLGKKTMEVLQEGDPGLMKKRAMLFPDQDKPVLSQILREAKEKADQCDKEKEEKDVARKVHFESLFDDYNGMIHLEALEMLSTQCDLKLQSLAMSQSGAQLEELQETISQVRDLCELPEDDEDSEVLSADQFAEELTKCLSGLKISMTPAKLIQVNNKVITRIHELGSESAVVVHQTSISALAEFTAAAMECFHKSAELLMAKTGHNTADEADNYVQLTGHLCARASAIANECSQLLTNNHPIANSSMITNIFLEASNSSSYMRNACQLLVPILQVGAVYS